MYNRNDLKELNLIELFASGQYIVPVYQRNYAWVEEQIEQLILDIWDYARQNQEREYYLGSLVVFQREGAEHFEVIDGQQRHTTLSILMAVLKNEFQQPLSQFESINLTYDSRKRAHRTLQALLAHHELLEYEESIKNAYEICKKYLSSTIGSEQLSLFSSYLLNKVKILRVLVPSDTDLNHYFEIMNNRGEQLEKHEVLKARLMNKLNKEDVEELTTFATIWDACSDMRRYVQYGFDKSVRHAVFSDNLDKIPADFLSIKNALGSVSIKNTELSILDSITVPLADSKQQSRQDDASSERFNSVINFSNFLLHALRIYLRNNIRNNPEFDIALDDKALLDIFQEQAEKIDPKEFVHLLLRLRFLFDSYIIKREWDDKWSLKRIRWYENRDNINYVNTFDDEQSTSQIILILSMLHVSFPSLIYKHWLNGVLLYLHEQPQTVNASEYLNYLEEYDDRLFFGRFSVQPLEYRDILYNACTINYTLDTSHLDQATNTQNYIFNRLDYLIWKTNYFYSNTLPQKMQLSSSVIDKFIFSFRSSVEHYYPQHPNAGEPLANCDRFGNLCLISRSNNSKLSNHLPTAKKEHYAKSTTIESLKQQLMMSYEHWGPEASDSIDEHQNLMIALLSKKNSDIVGEATYA